MDVHSKLKRVELLLLDVDGVLTDGSIIYSDTGDEIKPFNVKDGLGMRLLMAAGIKIAIITGRKSQALLRRCADLGITHIFDGVKDKESILDGILRQLGIAPENTAFIGDDLPDLKLMKRVGCAVAVADANKIVQDRADMVTAAGGGKGAVRELCETILKANGIWNDVLEQYN